MNQQNLFDYVMKTPHNTNPAILKQKIKDISGASSWNDLKDKPFDSKIETYTIFDNVNLVSDIGGSVAYIHSESQCEYNHGVDIISFVIDGVTYAPDSYFYNDEDQFHYYTLGVGDSGFGVSYNIYANDDDIHWFGEGSVGHTMSVILTRETVHKLDGKYLPDPFWVEEKRTLVVEGVSNRGNYNVQSQIEVGKEYTYLIDGVEYTGIGWYDSPDYKVNLYNAMGEEICIVYDYGINLFDHFFDPNVSHKIEQIEKVYHTYHDFMVIINTQQGDNGSANYKLVAGDFATTKTRILKGLPVTAYVCSTFVGDGFKGYSNYETLMTYQTENGEECMYSSKGDSFLINPDNTAQAD